MKGPIVGLVQTAKGGSPHILVASAPDTTAQGLDPVNNNSTYGAAAIARFMSATVPSAA